MDFTVSIAAPPHEFRTLQPALQRAGLDVDYLGCLPRRELWKAFAEHDALLMPSTVARNLRRLATPGVADDLRESARTNAARFPLSTTAAAQAALSDGLA